MSFMTSLESKIFDTLKPSLEYMGYSLVRVKNLGGNKNHPDIQLMVEFKDKADSVSHEDCKKISRHSSELLSVNDILESEYNLEVSSPGVERPLITHEDFNDPRFINKKIFVKLHNLIEEPVKVKNFRAVLLGCEANDKVNLELYENNSTRLSLNFEDIKSANLYFDYKELLKKEV